MSLFRPTAKKYRSRLCCLLAVLCVGLFGLSADSALAATKSSELAVCPGQTFSRPFEAFKDPNYYTLVEGSEFNEGEEGWELRNGATIVEGTRPDGSTGGVLEMPSGAIAVSPPVCVTLKYPKARAWVRTLEGDGGVSVGVVYAGAKATPGNGKKVGQLDAKPKDGWKLSKPFDVKPNLTGDEEGVREVRFVWTSSSKSGVFQLYGLFVDPRMR